MSSKPFGTTVFSWDCATGHRKITGLGFPGDQMPIGRHQRRAGAGTGNECREGGPRAPRPCGAPRALWTCSCAGSCQASAGWKSHRETVWPVHRTKAPGPGVAPRRPAENRTPSTLAAAPATSKGTFVFLQRCHLPAKALPTQWGLLPSHISGWRVAVNFFYFVSARSPLLLANASPTRKVPGR